jgi:hypothetical protein
MRIETVILIIIIIAGLLWAGGKLFSGEWDPGSFFSLATTTPMTEEEKETAQTTTKKTATTNTQKTVEPVPEGGVYAAGSLSINDLLRLKTKYACSFTVTNPYRKGTFYLDDNKWRGDFTSVVNGKNVTMTMIDAGGFIYLWREGQGTGLQVTAPGAAASTALTQAGGFATHVAMDYSCGSWEPDGNKFVPPSNVTFTDTEGYIYQD